MREVYLYIGPIDKLCSYDEVSISSSHLDAPGIGVELGGEVDPRIIQAATVTAVVAILGLASGAIEPSADDRVVLVIPESGVGVANVTALAGRLLRNFVPRRHGAGRDGTSGDGKEREESGGTHSDLSWVPSTY